MWAKYKNYILLHLTIFVWGFTGIIGQELEDAVSPSAISWYRMLIAAAALFIYIYFKKESFKIGWKGLLKTLGIGIIIAAHWITFFQAIHESTVSVALACMSTATFFTALIEPIFFRRRVIPYELVLGLVVVLGLYLIFKFESSYTLGIILALTSTLLASLFNVLNGLLIKEHSAQTITFYEMIGGCLGIMVYMAFNGGFEQSMFQLGGYEGTLIAVLGLICTALAFVIGVEVLKELSPYTVSVSVNLEPVYAIVLALIFYGKAELMHSGFYAGALIILLTVFLNAYLKKRFKRKEIVTT